MSDKKVIWTVPLRTRRDGDNRCWVMQGKTPICRCFGKPKAAEAHAHFIVAASAMNVILQLLLLGLARFESNEFCFQGLRYSCKDRNWQGLIDVIGIVKIEVAISEAEGKE